MGSPMCDMVPLCGNGNILEPRNSAECISTLMSSALDLLISKSIGNIFLPWVVHMCDMVTTGGKGNVLKPRNHCVYRQTDRQMDRQPDSSIPPTTLLRGVLIYDLPQI
jgi:hypothetical protein